MFCGSRRYKYAQVNKTLQSTHSSLSGRSSQETHMEIFWFFPTHGDSRYLGTSRGARTVDHAYLTQIAQAADSLGYSGALIPVGRSCEDPWVAASSLIGATKRLKFLLAVR